MPVSEKRFRNQFWGKFCCCLFKLHTAVVYEDRKWLKIMQWLFFTHEHISLIQEDSQFAVFSWFFLKANVGARPVYLCPMSDTILLEWSEVWQQNEICLYSFCYFTIYSSELWFTETKYEIKALHRTKFSCKNFTESFWYSKIKATYTTP